MPMPPRSRVDGEPTVGRASGAGTRASRHGGRTALTRDRPLRTRPRNLLPPPAGVRVWAAPTYAQATAPLRCKRARRPQFLEPLAGTLTL